jgi:hypothetical protein
VTTSMTTSGSYSSLIRSTCPAPHELATLAAIIPQA